MTPPLDEGRAEAQLQRSYSLGKIVSNPSAVKWLETIDVHAGSSLDSYRIRRIKRGNNKSNKYGVENKPVQATQLSTTWTIFGALVTFICFVAFSVAIILKFGGVASHKASINSYEVPFLQKCKKCKGSTTRYGAGYRQKR